MCTYNFIHDSEYRVDTNLVKKMYLTISLLLQQKQGYLDFL